MKSNGRLRRRVAMLIVIVGLVAAAASPTSAANTSVGASITLQPTSGPPTTKITLTGSGFGASETVGVRFDATQVATATSDGTGAVSTTFKVPKTALPGPHTVKAKGQTSTKAANATFTVRTDWSMPHFDAANTGNNPYENVLNADNVSSLVQAGTGTTTNARYVGGTPVVAEGAVYMTGYDGDLFAFSASCVSAPSGTCAPLWQAPALGRDVTVSKGVVYVSDNSGNLLAYHAAGANKYCNTGTTPKTCAPMWTGTTSAPGGGGQAPVIVNGTIYFPSGNTLYAFDQAASAAHCTGTYPNKTCTPLWSTGVGIANNTCCIIRGKPAVANGVAYLSAGRLYALSANNGSVLWTSADTNNPQAASGSPTVAGGVVYSNTSNGILSAFKASAPDSNCSGVAPARTCTPVWNTGVGYSYSTPTIANGVLYTIGLNSFLFAIDASGPELWRSAQFATFGYGASPAVANGVVYVGDYYGQLRAYRPQATAACTAAAPHVCPPIYTAPTPAVDTPVIADGVVYGHRGNNSSTTVTAYRLP